MKGSLLDIPSVRAYLGERILCQVRTNDKRLALTFDDGPHPRHTPALLEILGAKGIKATFFVIGRYVRRFEDVILRVAGEGHEIGNHTSHHWPLSVLPGPFVRREIAGTGALVTRIVGRRPRFLRPPMGWFDRRVLSVARGLGYQPVIGSIHPRDSRKPGTDVIVDRVLRRVEPGAIIILHDGGWRLASDRRQTLDAVDRITDLLLEQEYRFQTMSELVGEGPHDP